MGRFSISSLIILVAVCAATASFAGADGGALKTNNTSTVAVEDARWSAGADLDYLVQTITDKQTKKIHGFTRKLKDYFVKEQKPETIEALLQKFKPGEVVTMLVLSNLSKKPVQDIIDMKTSGLPWKDIAEKTDVKLRTVVGEVKEFRAGTG